MLVLDKSGRNKWAINHLPKIVAMMQVKKKHTAADAAATTTTTS